MHKNNPAFRMLTHQEAEEGFTLIELVTVILIIAILAVIAIPLYMRHRAEAIDATAKTDASNMALQIELWSTHHTQDLVPSFTLENTKDENLEEPLNGITPSEGNTIKVESGDEAGRYTITVTNKDGDKAKAENGGIKYTSDAGGFAN